MVVNRHWAELFGRGLVGTIEDFGIRGARPTHPGLLDWLATEWVRRRWSVKSLHRLLVTSATYRRRSDADGELRAADPENLWYARAARRRLPAELIRDNALAIAGLLSDKMHGPPVFPVQPSGVWNHIGVASNLWKTSRGEDLYRRGVYVYWRRTVPYPSFVSFDAPSREVCTVSRSQSNTPLQALTLLNSDFVSRQAGRLARELQAVESTEDDTALINALFRQTLAREARPEEIAFGIDYLSRQAVQHEAIRHQLVFAPDVPGSIEKGFRERLPNEKFLITPDANWRAQAGKWGGGYEGIMNVVPGRGPFALMTTASQGCLLYTSPSPRD